MFFCLTLLGQGQSSSAQLHESLVLNAYVAFKLQEEVIQVLLDALRDKDTVVR